MSYPRVHTRGPIEARVASFSPAERSRDIRGFTPAAPLKRQFLLLRRQGQGDIRGFTPAAPLKRRSGAGSRGNHGNIRGFTPAAPLKHEAAKILGTGRGHIRGFTPAAPLKPFPVHPLALGELEYPRVHTRGPIEARVSGRRRMRIALNIRGFTPAAPLKLLFLAGNGFALGYIRGFTPAAPLKRDRRCRCPAVRG